VTRIALVPRHRAAPALRGAYDRVSKLWGFPSSTPAAMRIVQCFSQRPEYVEPVGRGYHYIGWCAETPRDLLELVAVLVSRENECFY
jgi:hypothetical protein